MRDLDRAYSNFFNGMARHPSPRKRGVNDAFRFQGREIDIKRLNGKCSAVRLPKIGWVGFRDRRPRRGTVKNVTVSLDALGLHIAFACEIEQVAAVNICPSVGIDRGVANSLALSTGTRVCVPAWLEAIERRKRRAQKALARKKRGSVRRAKALRRLAKLSARMARARRDWHHKAARAIAERFGVVVVEDLKIRNMTAREGTLAQPGRNVRAKSGFKSKHSQSGMVRL